MKRYVGFKTKRTGLVFQISKHVTYQLTDFVLCAEAASAKVFGSSRVQSCNKYKGDHCLIKFSENVNVVTVMEKTI